MSAPSHPLQRIAPGGAEALFRLFQLYYYEGSDWADEDIGPDGLFDASCGGQVISDTTIGSRAAIFRS